MSLLPCTRLYAKRLTPVAAAFLILGGGLVLVGWLLDVTCLKSAAPGLVAMNPMSAILFGLIGVALVFAARGENSSKHAIFGTAIASVVALAGFSSMAGYLTGWEIGLDRLVFGQFTGENRVAPNTAFNFLILGLSIAWIDGRGYGRWVSQGLALLVLASAGMSLVGYGYGASGLIGIGSYIPMALPTAILFGLGATGILAARPQFGVAQILWSSAVGGVMARRLLPAGILIPVVLGFLRVVGQRSGYYDTEFGTAMMIVVTIILLVGSVLLTAASLNQIDQERKAAMDEIHRYAGEIQRLNQELELRVESRTAELATANRDLMQKNQENEMFVYSVSHDLRSPLVSLQGFSKELGVLSAELRGLVDREEVPASTKQRALELIDGDVQQSLRFIQTAAMRLSGIIDALLRLSRVGRVEFRPQRLEMDKLVSRVVESLSGELFTRNVDVQVSSLPPCHGDTTAVEQLVANLIENAVKYAAPDRNPVIEVGATTQPREEVTDSAQAVYFVRDNGLGIPAAYLGKIFQAFKRVHTQVARGEGMGLAIVRRIVERHGGRVWAESIEGQGSTFFFTLPRELVPTGNFISRQRQGDKSHEHRTDGHLVGGRR